MSTLNFQTLKFLALNPDENMIEPIIIKDGIIKKINKFKIDNRWGDIKWTKDDIDFLAMNINTLTNKEISKKLNRTEISISSMCARLNLKREKNILKNT